MRPICWVTLDKRRPALVLTRGVMVSRMSTVTIAPVTSTIHGIATEVLVGAVNGLRIASAVKCDQILSLPTSLLHDRCGFLLDEQEQDLHDAIQAAFDLV